MSTRTTTERDRGAGPSGRSRGVITVAGFCLLTIAPAVAAQSQSGGDSVDRSMRFVERSMEATDLLNAGKAAEALPILQELAGRDAELDIDGYAGLTLGDCLVKLGRYDEARRVFLTVAAEHPDRKPEIDQRLLDLELAGPITEDLILRLRAAAAVPDDSRFIAAMNLSRALQKKAKTLLDEALENLTRANESTSPIAHNLRTSLHWTMLADARTQLAAAIAEMENRWQRHLTVDEGAEGGTGAGAGAPGFTSYRSDWTVPAGAGQSVRIEVRQDKPDDELKLVIEGKPVSLSRAQAELIRIHQEHIAKILSEAAGGGVPAERR